ncbi:hypothetical protein SSCG_02307 [Streptomyces clavuligerus]|nr:hypothetical protein SSCG_02307 [Streptomyces clavuligerus]
MERHPWNVTGRKAAGRNAAGRNAIGGRPDGNGAPPRPTM